MPKQILKIDQFHGGLNSHADPRDIDDNQLSALQNASVSSIGRIVVAGGKDQITSNSFPAATGGDLNAGYGLFAFSADWDLAGTSNAETSYLVLWEDAEHKLYWMVDDASQTWAQVDAVITAAWATGTYPCFYFIDGALRMSDGKNGAVTAAEESLWWGHIKQELFLTHGESTSVNGWFAYAQELKAPIAGLALGPDSLSGTEVDAVGDITDDALSIHVRHNKALLTKMHDSDNTELIFSDFTSQEMTNSTYFNLTESETDEYLHDGGTHQGDKFFYSYFANDTDISSGTTKMTWRHYTTNAPDDSLTDSPPTFKSGQSIYGIFEVSDIGLKMWAPDGDTGGTAVRWTHEEDETKLRVYSVFNTTDGSANYMTWKVGNPHTEGWNPGEYRVVEFPFDEAGISNNVPGTLPIVWPTQFTIVKFEVRLSTAANTAPWTGGGPTEQGYPLKFGPFFIGDSGQVFNDPVNAGVRNWGYSYIYGGKQESDIFTFVDTISLQPHSFAVALTVYHRGVVGGTLDNRITGANIYFFDQDDVPYKVADCDFVLKGLKSESSSRFPDDTAWVELATNIRVSNTVNFNEIPLFTTFEALHGYGPEEGGDKNFRASFGNAVLNGRRLIVGPMYMDTDDGASAQWHRDTMIGTSPGEFDLFPNKSRNIDVATEDGDRIMGLATYADRILQFKKNTMYLINITKSTEYLEDTFRGKGVDHPAAIFKTDYGIAWANKNGCYFYNGKEVKNLTDMKIDDDVWETHMDTNSLVGYHPNSRKIIVTGGTGNNVNAYVFDLVIQSWSYMSSVFDDAPMTNFVNNSSGDLLFATEQSNGLQKWTEAVTATTNYDVTTKDFDFGNPGVRKKVYKVYITHKGNGTRPTPTFDVNGETSLDKTFTESLGGSSSWTTTSLTPSTSSQLNNIYSFQLKISGSMGTDFEINDISIVYRLKPVK